MPLTKGILTDKSEKGAFVSVPIDYYFYVIGAATGFLDLNGIKVDVSSFDASSFNLNPLKLLSSLRLDFSTTGLKELRLSNEDSF